MKQQFLRCLLAVSLLFGISQFSYAQTKVYVKVQPKAVVVAKPAAPHTGYVWVGDEWTPRNGSYVRTNGHWVAPHKGYVWVAGHWNKEGHGYYWVPGHWRRV